MHGITNIKCKHWLSFKQLNQSSRNWKQNIHRNSAGNNEVESSHKNTTNHVVISAISKGSKLFEIPEFYKNFFQNVLLCTVFRIKSLHVRRFQNIGSFYCDHIVIQNIAYFMSLAHMKYRLRYSSPITGLDRQ